VAWHPFLEHDGPAAFVHRGGAAEATENSISAFERAWAMGFRYFETDVHATSDGVLVAFHDATLDRVSDTTGAIAELPWADVRRVRLHDGSPPPTLVELLDALPEARVNVDLKSDASVGPFCALLSARRELLDRLCVASFSDDRLTQVRRRLGERVCTSTGPAGVLAHRLAITLHRPTPQRYIGDCFQVPVTVGAVRVAKRSAALPVITPAFVEAAHAMDRPVHAWTIDDRDEMIRLLDMGVDGIMTDRPEVLRAVLLDRGQWNPT
jgi:glycerophosphoryl diester phosphodiesterase